MGVIGYHGTSWEAAVQIENGNIEDPSDQSAAKNVGTDRFEYRWLGKGLYFFQESKRLAEKWVSEKPGVVNPTIVRADISLDGRSARSSGAKSEEFDGVGCHIDLVADWYGPIMNKIYESLVNRYGEDVIIQKPITIESGQVKESRKDDGERFGWNSVDYAVIEELVKYFEETEKMNIGIVRAIFIEGKELYKNSYFYDGAHICITVRPPYSSLNFMEKTLCGS